MGESLMVGMAEVKVTSSPDDTLVALGLGSCIGVCAYDPQARVAGLAHVVLPESSDRDACPGKFADTAVPLLLEMMQKKGARIERIRVALAGGAQLFAFNGSGPRLEIGPRNAAAVQAALKKQNIPVIATNVGGSVGRTVHLFADGRARVKTIGQQEQDLANLADTKTPGAMPATPVTTEGSSIRRASAPIAAAGAATAPPKRASLGG